MKRIYLLKEVIIEFYITYITKIINYNMGWFLFSFLMSTICLIEFLTDPEWRIDKGYLGWSFMNAVLIYSFLGLICFSDRERYDIKSGWNIPIISTVIKVFAIGCGILFCIVMKYYFPNN